MRIIEERWRNYGCENTARDKPLAVMFPLRGDDGLDDVRSYAQTDCEEAELLLSPSRPIVLLEQE